MCESLMLRCGGGRSVCAAVRHAATETGVGDEENNESVELILAISSIHTWDVDLSLRPALRMVDPMIP